MIEWNKYIKYGKFISTNNIKLKYKWEFDRLNKNEYDKNLILYSILSLAHPYDIVAIHTINPESLRKYCKAIYHTNTDVSENFPNKKYILYDDVVTTGKSMIKAIEHYKKKYNIIPEKCICIIDRRSEVSYFLEKNVWDLDIISIQENIFNRKIEGN